MKTSPTQFEMLLAFMEQHGDLCKPSIKAKGRLLNIQKWAELHGILNSDGSGEHKSLDKWKKVWSDLKNNTKKKAAKINAAARGTGGGPALMSKLSDLEQRVLNMMGMEAATGLSVEEAGLAQMPILNSTQEVMEFEVRIATPTPPSPPLTSLNHMPSQVMHSPSSIEVNGFSMPGPSRRHTNTNTMLEDDDPYRGLSPFLEANEEDNTFIHTPEPVPAPAPAPRRRATPPPPRRRNRAPVSSQTSPRRRQRPTQPQQAAQLFLQSDTQWREFNISQHQEKMAYQREQQRIKIMELEIQKNWQALADKALNILDKIASRP